MHNTNDILKNYLTQLQEKSAHQVGYCYNYQYDIAALMPFFSYTINNLGDPFVPSLYKVDSRQFEIEVLQFFAELFQATDWWGYVTAGGTEGNLYAMALARETLPQAKLYASKAAHYSIPKAAHLYKLHLIPININERHEMDYEDLYQKLEPGVPAIINCTIGTTFTGAVDNIDKILEVLEKKNVREFYLHCDGALNGMYVPYLDESLLTFKKPIHSICISGHKFIGSPFPCGVVLARRELAQKFSQEIEYIGSKDSTILGSRNGHNALVLWYAISQRKAKFAEEVTSNIQRANLLVAELQKHHIETLLNPYSSIVVFPKPNQALIDRWQLTVANESAHFAVMQQHHEAVIHQFIKEYLNDNY